MLSKAWKEAQIQFSVYQNKARRENYHVYFLIHLISDFVALVNYI